MSETHIIRTEQDGSITYTAIIDGTEAAFLAITAATRKVSNVETMPTYRRQGLARTLWQAANAEAECFHDLDHHRTEEGDIFAHAMGGRTISDELGHEDECFVCAGDCYGME